MYTPPGLRDTMSKNESSVPIFVLLFRSRKIISEILYFLNPLSLFGRTVMFAGSSCESQSCDFGSSANAVDGERILDQKSPPSPPLLNQPPPPPPEEDPPPPPPPPEKLKSGRESVRKRAEAAEEIAMVAVRVFLKREEELVEESLLLSSEEERWHLTEEVREMWWLLRW